MRLQPTPLLIVLLQSVLLLICREGDITSSLLFLVGKEV